MFCFQHYLNLLPPSIWVLKQTQVVSTDFIHTESNLQPVAEVVHTPVEKCRIYTGNSGIQADFLPPSYASIQMFCHCLLFINKQLSIAW